VHTWKGRAATPSITFACAFREANHVQYYKLVTALIASLRKLEKID
jgi:hypothetical protein